VQSAATVDTLFPEHVRTMRARAEHALQLAGLDALVCASGLAHYQFLDDQPYPFKPNPHFKAWAPVLDAPGSFVAYVPGQRPQLYFHQPEDYWHKPPELPQAEWLREFEVHVLRTPDDMRAHVPRGAAYVGEAFPGLEQWGFAALNPVALVDSLHYARGAKTPYELACVREAGRLGALGHAAAARAFAAGASEYAIHLAYLAATGHREEQLPYPNIIALNEGAAILHYVDLKVERPARRLSCLVDAGGQFRGYASDITRTHVNGGGRFAELVAGLDALQRELCELVAPGVDYPSIHLAAHAKIAALLRASGVIRCSAEAAVESGLSGTFFPHGIGHLLGLQVHDVGGFMASERGGTIAKPPGHPYLRLTRRLEPGTVVTIEPGVYFVDLLLDAARRDGRGRDIDWSVVDELKPYGGARIEDDVAAVPGGRENLTRAAVDAALAAA
jgi:Xaa-Pro dipeptidase